MSSVYSKPPRNDMLCYCPICKGTTPYEGRYGNDLPHDSGDRMIDGYREFLARYRQKVAGWDAEARIEQLAASCEPEDVKAFLEATKHD